jgi:hypothetical protein
MNDHDLLRQSFDAELNSNFTETELRLENEDDLSDSEEHVEAYLDVTSSVKKEMGLPDVVLYGVATFRVRTPKGAGKGRNTRICEVLINQLGDKNIDGIEFDSGFIKTVGVVHEQFQQNVIFFFRFDKTNRGALC